ncbi:hypothetical protein OsJ_08050 [Oryza sativa Japonica Group]|uniref:Ubiquinol oxidase n=1 Tax=Oryza sativa subsp. japonica TaxID=39947 RepID=A3AAF9_ORYSJ|nr:hypothetical protein OsJ_08050 [Oryza sativa Japonica Group]
MGSRAAGSVLLRHLCPRVSSSTSAAAHAHAQRPPLAGAGGGGVALWARLLSTSAAAAKEETAASKENTGSTAAAKAEATKAAKEGPGQCDCESRGEQLLGHRGVEARDQGRRPVEVPWETYSPDTTIDLKKHHEPKVLLDKVAYWTVKALRVPTDIFFPEEVRVPRDDAGDGGRGCRGCGGWIRALLEEAENERMHLMTFMEVAKPRWYERALVLAVQGVFFNAYFLGYLLSPKLAHRVVGYLEEEAIHSYTEYLKDIEAGKIENVPAPPIAIDYWRLPAGATLKDVVVVVRADEAHHRDVNHFASDVHFQGMDLKDIPAPLDYH